MHTFSAEQLSSFNLKSISSISIISLIMATEAELVGVDDIQVGGIVDSEKNSQMNGEVSTENKVGQEEDGAIEKDQTILEKPLTNVGDSVMNQEVHSLASASNVEGKVAEAEKAVVNNTVKRRFCTTERDGEVEIRCKRVFLNCELKTVVKVLCCK